MDLDYIGKNTDAIIEYYEEITSTNERAKEIAEMTLKCVSENKIVEKCDFEKKLEKINLIIADNQTQGKGTNGRIWLSNKNENILMTMIFYPHNSIEKLDGVTFKIAEMVKIAIKDLYNIELTIKQPNDLLLNGKKICGILTESAIQCNCIKYLLIGIGFNVNQINFEIGLNEIATSLKKEMPQNEYNREEIIIKIVNNVKSLISCFD